jgi:carboxylesterase type B
MAHPSSRRAWLLACAAASTLAAVSLGAQTARPFSQPLRVQGGLVSGVPGRNPAITEFKGIPFAAPPVGQMRWQAPKPPVAWTGVKTADTFGASCVQTVVQERKPWTYEFMTHGDISEDCLFVNVWTPAKTAADRLPVFVYIYGGGNTEGSGMVPVYDGEGLASKGVVFVNFNYRVGVMGFFAHPDLSTEAAYHASGNYGLLDQIAAVRWVHDNIAAFGGDPTRVTIAGQSAGAAAVHNLTGSPLAKGLFHRAIAESGSSITTGGAGRSMADLEAQGVRFASAKGARSLADLRAMAWKDVVAPVQAPSVPGAAGGRGGAGFNWSIVVDGYTLPVSVAEAFAKGLQNDVPTITGSNADENGASPSPTATAQSFAAQALQRYADTADEFLKLYPAADDAQAKIAANESARDSARMSTYLWAMNRTRTAKTPVYLYFWNHALPGPDAAQYGAFHTSEVPYVLNTLSMSDRPYTDADRKIADMLSAYWTNFARTGNPNGPGLPEWPAASTNAKTMVLGDKPGAIPTAGSPEKIEFHRKALVR